MIKNFEPRLYQQTIFANCLDRNSLVVLPTGLGKTNVFLMIAAARLKTHPESKILLLGPTRPLIDQYKQVFLKFFDITEDEMIILTGQISPTKRPLLFNQSKIIFSTPQGLENDLISGRISLENVSLLGFDEAHKATGDYSYVWIAKQYEKQASQGRIVALTASPGADIEKITQVCTNLHIENIEIRTHEDPDVKPYIKEVDKKWVKVDFPQSFKEIKTELDLAIKTKLTDIAELGVLTTKGLSLSKRDLLGMQATLHGEIAKGNKEMEVLRSISLVAEVMKIQHGLELLETQGLKPLHMYLDGILKQSYTSKVKAVQNLARDINFKNAIIKTNALCENKILHPKMIELKKQVRNKIAEKPNVKIIIFNQYRDNAQNIVEEINKLSGVKCKLFVGQAKKNNTGLSQKEQKQILDEFRNDEFNLICMTSVGEEGLDIPKVDTVIFYEPIPSAIRQIQRRGRTGRNEKGEVIILMTKGTRDEAYRWSAHHKEKKMYVALKKIKKSFCKNIEQLPKSQTSLKDYKRTETDKQKNGENQINIIADHREKGSRVIKELFETEAKIQLEQLEVADYILSSDVAVEYKTKEDFVGSITDGRLLEQIKQMKKNFAKPVLLIEGEEDIYSIRNIHPKAINGMLMTISISYKIPLLYSRNPKETAELLLQLAKKEQLEGNTVFTYHSSKKAMSQKEQQVYIISSIPGIGTTLAKQLLKEFCTIKNIINAKDEELLKIKKLGVKKVKDIKSILQKKY